MRAKILKLLLVSMVFVSVEGVADAVDESSFHQTHHEHTGDAANEWNSDADDQALDNCEHFCHGHAVGLVAQLAQGATPENGIYVPTPPAEKGTQLRAPPTPPPNIQS